MVVNGGRNHNLVLSYNKNSDMINHSAMAGRAVLICQQNSHPFLDRSFGLEQPVKIGRSVARARAAQNNGIFDCKVLSRNHALLWYANGKFFLQDTKSSNGTFVNNQRLSKSGEESLPREVCYGDIVQFGVDVLENSRKVTHGCIVAILKLFLPDGKEAKASPSTAVLSNVGRVPVEDLYQLNQHIQEALQREQMLQTKLASLQQLVMSLQQASDLSWRALIAEDRLLSRVETLETQLQTYSKNFPDDKLREELRKLNEDKISYQTTAKEVLKKILEEKLEAIKKCEDVKITLMNTEAECANFKELMEQSHVELKELALEHGAQLIKTEELQNMLQATEEQMKEVTGRLESDNEELNNEVQKLLGNEAILQERLQKLEAADDSDEEPYKHHFLEGFTSGGYSDVYKPPQSSSDNQQSGEDIYLERIGDEMQEDPTDVNSKIDLLCTKLAKSFHEHQKTKEIVDIMAAQLQLLQDEKCTKLQRINALEYELEIHTLQLRGYRDENRVLEQKLDVLAQRLEHEESTLLENSLNSTTLIPLTIEEAEQGEEKVGNSPSKEKLETLQKQISELKELLSEAREKAESSEEKVKALQIDLDIAKNSLSETTENLTCTKEKLQEAQKIKEEKETTVAVLKQQMKSLEESLMETTILQEKLELQHNSINKQEEETVQLKKLLSETQQAAKQYKNELEQVKERLRVLTEEREEKSNEETSENWDNRLDNRTIEDYAAVKQECETLKGIVQELESQLLSVKTEAKLQTGPTEEELEHAAVVARLETELLELGLQQESSESSESAITRLTISDIEEELILVKQQYMYCNEEKTYLERELKIMRQEYQGLGHQSPFYNVDFVLVLVILFVAVIAAFYRTLSFVLGTTDGAQPPLD